jgi:hypothetical protein
MTAISFDVVTGVFSCFFCSHANSAQLNSTAAKIDNFILTSDAKGAAMSRAYGIAA